MQKRRYEKRLTDDDVWCDLCMPFFFLSWEDMQADKISSIQRKG